MTTGPVLWREPVQDGAEVHRGVRGGAVPSAVAVPHQPDRSLRDGRSHGFQISQRADYFEVEVGLETTLKRPIINTRD